MRLNILYPLMEFVLIHLPKTISDYIDLLLNVARKTTNNIHNRVNRKIEKFQWPSKYLKHSSISLVYLCFIIWSCWCLCLHHLNLPSAQIYFYAFQTIFWRVHVCYCVRFWIRKCYIEIRLIYITIETYYEIMYGKIIYYIKLTLHSIRSFLLPSCCISVWLMYK